MHLWRNEEREKKKQKEKKGAHNVSEPDPLGKTKKKNWCYYYMLLPPKRTENNKTTDEIVRSQLTIQEKSRKERCCQWMETNKESHCRGVNVAASPCL